MPMSLNEKRELFDRDQRLFTVIQMLGLKLADAGYTWQESERKAYDWAWRTLQNEMKELAA
jgi:hypothetical protein